MSSIIIFIIVLICVVLLAIGISLKNITAKIILITISSLSLLATGVFFVVNNIDFNFKSDEDKILGSWEMNTTDSSSATHDLFTEIEFFSDGTCTVGGSNGTESGEWSIIDDKLKVQGSFGGMFFDYSGFTCNYELKDNTLIIYSDDGTEQYVYNKVI